MKVHDFKFEIKALHDEGTFEGLASVYGNLDLGGDVVQPGAFTKTLQTGTEFPLLASHDPTKVIGVAAVSEHPRGLGVTGKLVLTVAAAKETYDLLKARALRGLSIGYTIVRDEVRRDGVRLLKELRLHEISLVAVPMNPAAQVTAVKSQHQIDIKELRQLFKRYEIPQLAARKFSFKEQS